MEGRVKKNSRHYFLFSFTMVFFCSNFFVLASHELISFDVVAPTTWYEKGLHSILYVWNKARFIVGNTPQVALLDVLLSHVAYAQFCIEKSYQEQQQVLNEDIFYFYTVIKTIESVLHHIGDEMNCNDYRACLLFMINATKSRLIVLYPNVIMP